LSLARDVANRYRSLPQVEAVALAGSQATGMADLESDLDMYVYVRAEIPLALRAEIARAGAEYVEVDNRFWEPGDEWVEKESGTHVDVMFRATHWIEEQLDRVLRRYEASVGYSTCLWYNVLSSQVLFDRKGWFVALQQGADQAYPEPLKRVIIAKNHPILRRNASSYMYQIRRAVELGDLVSVNHRVAALLASYFDILFAVNEMPHPGEKRLIKIASEECRKVPQGMGQGVNELIGALSRANQEVIQKAEALVEGLDSLLIAEGLFPD
jgi:predicted nucleotidyltransferase